MGRWGYKEALACRIAYRNIGNTHVERVVDTFMEAFPSQENAVE
jgi:hypothetical protein